jgi:peptidyl-prolyl cis-trans isomerase B (cyclophilin B)
LKRLLVVLTILAAVACSSETATSENEAAPAGTTTAAEPAPDTATETTASAAPAAEEEKPMSAYENKVVELHTTAGQIDIRFFPDVAPKHVRNFIDLAEKGFYNNTKFHRVIPGFMIQGGDPNTVSGDPATWGTGGSNTRLQSEFNTVSHKRGILSMARAQDPDSASSQFFIVVKDSPFLDRQYTVFGQVTKGMDVADKIVGAPRGPNDRPNDPVAISRAVVRDAREDEKSATPK